MDIVHEFFRQEKCGLGDFALSLSANHFAPKLEKKQKRVPLESGKVCLHVDHAVIQTWKFGRVCLTHRHVMAPYCLLKKKKEWRFLLCLSRLVSSVRLKFYAFFWVWARGDCLERATSHKFNVRISKSYYLVQGKVDSEHN